MADPLDLLMSQLLDDAIPLSPERGFTGPGTYTICPICGAGLRWPEPEGVELLSRIEDGRVEYDVRVPNLDLDGFERELGSHLAVHGRMEIYRVLARLVEEARKGRKLRRRIEAMLAE